MIRKGISLFIIISLVLSLSASASLTYKDVTGSEWYYSDLMYLSAEGIINGMGDGSFSGAALLNKDALIKTIVVAKGYNLGNADGYWAQNYIDKASALGWLSGTITGMYTSPINRYETCRIIVNALGTSVTYPSNLSAYTIYISDYDSIPANYKDVVLKAYALGIITGYADNTFRGTNTLTRAEMTAILARFINDAYRKTPLDPAKLAKIEQFANDPDNNVLRLDIIKFENNRLMYYDAKTDAWLSISSSGLNPNMGRISEDIYVDIASYINRINDMSIETTYSYDNFYMYIYDGDTNYFSYSVNDSDNTITLDLLDLYYEPYLELSTPIDEALQMTLQTVNAAQYPNMDTFIKDNYLINISATPVTNTQTFGTTTVTTIAQQGSYLVEITVN